MNNRGTILIWVGLLALLFSCSSNLSKNRDGNSTELRIVSLAPSITKELVYLGVKDQIVGATTFCDITADNAELIVGNAMDVNIEKILLLKPTIVFATELVTASNIESLRQNGVKVHVMGKMFSFKHICDELETIGRLVGKEKQALTIIDAAKTTIDSLRKTLPASEKKRVLFQIGAKPLFAVIPNSFMNDLITYANCENLFFDLEHGTVTRESVLHRNPDVIFIAAMGMLGTDEKATWESYKELNAVKNNMIFIVDSNTACTPSVIAFTETFSQVITYIYK